MVYIFITRIRLEMRFVSSNPNYFRNTNGFCLFVCLSFSQSVSPVCQSVNPLFPVCQSLGPLVLSVCLLFVAPLCLKYPS